MNGECIKAGRGLIGHGGSFKNSMKGFYARPMKGVNATQGAWAPGYFTAMARVNSRKNTLNSSAA
jgi:hypothetical protein